MDKRKWNVIFTIKGPAGVAECPNNKNPVECTNLASLLAMLADNLPLNESLGLETIGIKVQLADAPNPEIGGEMQLKEQSDD